MIFFKKRRAAEINALEQFLSSEQKAGKLEESISRGIIELRYNGRHGANGLLITTDGYFLTAEHCVHNLPDSIKLYNGREYPIKKVCARGKREDIALVKAKIPGECLPLLYQFNNDIHEHDDVALITRINGKLKYKYGFIFSEYNYDMIITRNGKSDEYPDQFMVRMDRIKAKPGDSGGLVLNINKMIIGIVSGGDNEDILQFGSIVKIGKALELVSFYTELLKRKM